MISKNNRRENLIFDEYRALNVQLHENEYDGHGLLRGFVCGLFQRPPLPLRSHSQDARQLI
jgi:hypothetical protein